MDIQKIQQRNSFMSDKLFPILHSLVKSYIAHKVLTKCLTPCEHVSDDSASYSKQIPEGSVIFAKNGAASMSNKKRLTKIRCCIDMNTMAVFPKNDLILPDFLFATIEAMDVSSHVRQGAIPSISPKSIEDSYIAMPTKEEQYRYISMTKQADKSGFELRKSIDAIDAVIKSLINS